MVAQDPTLGNNADILVIRESMKKFESGSNNLEILEVTLPGKFRTVFNRGLSSPIRIVIKFNAMSEFVLTHKVLNELF